MALAHQARDAKLPPRMIATVGSADSGKTVYLGMLTDMLSRKYGQLELIAKGALSVSLQQSAMESLSNNRFPTKTPNEPDRWNWLNSQIKVAGKRQTADLIIPEGGENRVAIDVLVARLRAATVE